MKVPFRETLLIDIGLVVLLMVAAAIIYFFVQRIWDVFRKKGEKKYDKEGCFGFLLKFFLLNFLLIFSLAIIGFAALIQTYNDFNEKKLIAEVTCERVEPNDNKMRFIITQKYGVDAGNSRQFYLSGDQWFIKGDIIKWKNGVNIFGKQNMYRLNHVGGRYKRSVNRKDRIQTIYDLNQKEAPSNWKWLYNIGKKMPLIQGLYGKSILKSPNYYRKFEIYVDVTGFTVKVLDKE